VSLAELGDLCQKCRLGFLLILLNLYSLGIYLGEELRGVRLLFFREGLGGFIVRIFWSDDLSLRRRDSSSGSRCVFWVRVGGTFGLLFFFECVIRCVG